MAGAFLFYPLVIINIIVVYRDVVQGILPNKFIIIDRTRLSTNVRNGHKSHRACRVETKKSLKKYKNITQKGTGRTGKKKCTSKRRKYIRSKAFSSDTLSIRYNSSFPMDDIQKRKITNFADLHRYIFTYNSYT